MANKKIWLGILVMVLVFGMMVVGCDNDSTNDSKTDSALNGTWVSSDGSGWAYKFNNGILETSRNGKPREKLTYTANDGKLTATKTHVYGDPAIDERLELKWYSKAEVEALGYNSQNFGFATLSGTYSVSGNTLTLNLEGTRIYTKE
jgi:hypothetical protein